MRSPPCSRPRPVAVCVAGPNEPPMSVDAWVSLFSGGKDSSWALHRALETDRPVERLLTVHPPADSYLYHVPATELAPLAAESVGIPLVEVTPSLASGAEAADAGRRGDRELEPVAEALSDLSAELGGIGGLTVGAVASEFQATRMRALAERFDAELFAPLWQADPGVVADRMLPAGFEILVVRVAAAGLDESWLGRRLDRDAFRELAAQADRYGVHPMGEGGEYETIVTDGPHMDRRLDLTHEPDWDGDRGTLRVTDARLEAP